MTGERREASGDREDELRAFAAALAHDLRTPLAAVCGEVDLALHRDRTAESYRDALTRIRAGLSELLDLSGALAVLGEEDSARDAVARLDTVLASAASQYAAVSIRVAGGERSVVGGTAQLVRALGLVIEHMVGCSPGDDSLTVEEATGDPGTPRGVRLVIRTGRAGTVRHGTFRLRAAAYMLRQCGGALAVVESAPGAAVEICLETGAREPFGHAD